MDYRAIVEDVPQLKRGRVWCTVCGHSQGVNSAHALQRGWPKHCGYTMTIDSSEERARFAADRREETRGEESNSVRRR